MLKITTTLALVILGILIDTKPAFTWTVENYNYIYWFTEFSSKDRRNACIDAVAEYSDTRTAAQHKFYADIEQGLSGTKLEREKQSREQQLKKQYEETIELCEGKDNFMYVGLEFRRKKIPIYIWGWDLKPYGYFDD